MEDSPVYYDEDFDEEEYDEDDDSSRSTEELEPPVPPGQKNLSPALQNFVQVFEIDPFLVEAAAEASPDPKAAPEVDYRELVARLPRSECDEFLARLAQGDPGVRLELRKRLGMFLPQECPAAAKPRSFQELLQRAEQLKKAHLLCGTRHLHSQLAGVGRNLRLWIVAKSCRPNHSFVGQR